VTGVNPRISSRAPLLVYRGDHLLLELPLPLEEHAQRRPAPIRKEKRRGPHLHLSGRPAATKRPN